MLISVCDEGAPGADADPILNAFLGFIADDLAHHPERLRPLSATAVADGLGLTGGDDASDDELVGFSNGGWCGQFSYSKDKPNARGARRTPYRAVASPRRRAFRWPNTQALTDRRCRRETRERIVEAAAAAFRRDGISQVGASEVMRQAGLTHGGFYAHFDSKDDLVAAAVPHAMSEAHANLDRLGGGVPSGLLDVAQAYLTPAHLNNPDRGWPIAVLGNELARGKQPVRETLAREIRKRLSQLDASLPPETSAATRRQQTAGALACMVGGLILARGLKQSERAGFLADCQAFLKEALTRARRARLSINRWAARNLV
jgi:TetR/AcrR family transcriptional regulator, transcriptional repressor for nem operon